ncbi:MAG: hypothetical protein WBV89_19485 [Ilumatobacter sp.]
MAELVRVDAADPGGLRDPPNHACDHVAVEAPAVEHHEPIQVIGPVRLVVVESFDELRMEGDVAVVVQFADRHTQPVPAVHEHDCVGGQFAELADSQRGAGEHLDHPPSERILVGGGAHQVRGVRV